MKRVVLISLLMAFFFATCSNDKEDVQRNGDYYLSDSHHEMSFISNQEFYGFVNNKIFLNNYGDYSLSNENPVADTRVVAYPRIHDDKQGEWLNYCPMSFWFGDNEMYCSVKMDLDTYAKWHEYSKNHKIELYVHSSFTYNANDGMLKTEKQIMPGEKRDCIYHMAMNGNDYNRALFAVVLDKPFVGSLDGKTTYDFMYIDYERVSRNYPFDMELKVFDTNEEAVAFAKYLLESGN